MKRKKASPVFKEYTMGQLILLPTNLDELIPPNHLVRVVNAFVEQMDLAPLLARYKGGGTSSYHPKMMLKVFIYAYTQKIFSSRRIAKALRESIPLMWLSGNNRPDFRTINRFRGELLKGIIEEVFLAVLSLLIDGGYVKLEDYFVDGTKVEANANRYSYVWAKSTQRYQKQLAEKVASPVGGDRAGKR
jgi:transposase